MDQNSHVQTELERHKPTFRASIATRNYKHIAAEFPSNTTPNELESDGDDGASCWSRMRCPFNQPYESWGRHSCHFNHFVVAVDGANRGNGTSNARAAISVYFGPRNAHNFVGLLDFDPRPTNQKAELSAVINALEIFRSIRRTDPELKELENVTLTVKSDSAYVVSCMTEYIFKWHKNGFKNARGQPVLNKDLLSYIDQLVNELTGEDQHIFFWHVLREYNKKADAMVNKALDAHISRPKVYIVAPNTSSESAGFVAAYKELCSLLEERAEVTFIGAIHRIKNLVDGPQTRFFFVDDGALGSENRLEMIRFANMVHSQGSRVVLGALLPHLGNPLDINYTLQEIFGLPWQDKGLALCSDHLILNRWNRVCDLQGLLDNTYVDAYFLHNVPLFDQLYNGNESNQVYAACRKFGHGYVGYVGDTSSEPQFTFTVLALLGLPPKYEGLPHCLISRATKMNLEGHIASVDEDQVGF